MKLSVIKKALTKVWQSSTTKALLFVSGIFLVKTVFADDVLADTTTILKDTYNGSLKTWAYAGEAVAALFGLLFVRSIKGLFVIFAVVIFLAVVTTLAHF